MYCPKCATENIETASFCRSCGVDISFVSQALSGMLPVAAPMSGNNLTGSGRRKRKDKDEGPPTMARGVEKLFMGIGFVFVSLAIWRFMPGGFAWWFWMLIPAFAMMGGGVSQIIQSKQRLESVYQPPTLPATRPSYQQPSINAPATPAADFPYSRKTGEILQPPSVTEATTRHLKTNVEDPASKI
jgi:hypothetical protein